VLVNHKILKVLQKPLPFGRGFVFCWRKMIGSRKNIRKCGLLIFLLISTPGCLNAQLKEIRSLQQRLPYIKDSTQYIDALNRLGVLYHLKSIDTCFYYAQKAKAVADRLQYAKGQAGAIRNFGLVYLLKRNTRLALKYFNNCLPIYKSLHDSADECQVLMSIGNALATEKKFTEGFVYLTKAYNLGKTLENDSVQSLVIVNLVNDTSLSKDSIIHLLNTASAIASHYKDYRMLIIINEAKAEQLTKAGKQDESLLLLQQAYTLAKEQGVEYQIIDAGIQLGNISLSRNDTTSAIIYFKDALKVANGNGYQGLVTDAALQLYNYYYKKNDLAQASIYAALLISNYQVSQQALRQSGTDYLDYTLQQEELENLKNDKRITNYILIVLSALSLTVIALLFFMLRSFNNRKKYMELLRERDEQTRRNNTELQHKNDFNNRLISLLAHDFRQPLAAVKSMMSLLKQPDILSKEDISFLAERIETSSDTSLEIFDNILDWIKKQVTGFVYEPVNIPLRQLIDEACQSLQYITNKFGVAVINEIADGTFIYADREMLQFVHRNLIHNAIKFSPENSSIAIRSTITGNEIIVSVTDQGKGMPKEKVESLFNIFSNTQYSNDKEKGSGVALVICKDFVERMQGRIWAESELGRGTTFFYALPLGD